MNPLQAGIAAAREGRQVEARTLLMQALQTNPRSEQGWLWMSTVVEADTERRICLEQVLAINPHNQTAQVGLEKFKAGNGSPGSQPSNLPLSQPGASQNRVQNERATLTPAPISPANSVAGPPSPHTLPTLGMSPIAPGAGRIRRLDAPPTAVDGLAQLRSAQFQPQPVSAPARSPSQSDSLAAMILIGGLSITAIAGILMLIALWLIGWPPS